MNTTNILSTIDSEITERLASNRRKFFQSSALKLGAMASAPMVLAMTSQESLAKNCRRASSMCCCLR